MRLTPKQKQLVKEYAKSLQSKKLNEATKPRPTANVVYDVFEDFAERDSFNTVMDFENWGLSVNNYKLNKSSKTITLFLSQLDDDGEIIPETRTTVKITIQ